MVELPHHCAFDISKIGHHAVAVELFGSAMHGDNPIMSMQLSAFALVVEAKAMAG